VGSWRGAQGRDRRLSSGADIARRKLSPIHPGEILQEEFLGPLGISQYRVAKETSVSSRRIRNMYKNVLK
jgi:hypothetical protein